MRAAVAEAEAEGVAEGDCRGGGEGRAFDEDELLLGFHMPPGNSVAWLHLHAIYPRSRLRRPWKYTSLTFKSPEWVLERLESRDDCRLLMEPGEFKRRVRSEGTAGVNKDKKQQEARCTPRVALSLLLSFCTQLCRLPTYGL